MLKTLTLVVLLLFISFSAHAKNKKRRGELFVWNANFDKCLFYDFGRYMGSVPKSYCPKLIKNGPSWDAKRQQCAIYNQDQFISLTDSKDCDSQKKYSYYWNRRRQICQLYDDTFFIENVYYEKCQDQRNITYIWSYAHNVCKKFDGRIYLGTVGDDYCSSYHDGKVRQYRWTNSSKTACIEYSGSSEWIVDKELCRINHATF